MTMIYISHVADGITAITNHHLNKWCLLCVLVQMGMLMLIYIC